MIPKLAFYEPYYFPDFLSPSSVSDIRKLLIKSLNITRCSDAHILDIQIQIDNPRMSNKSRHLGSISAPKILPNNRKNISPNSHIQRSISFNNVSCNNISVSPSTKTPNLTRLSVSQKKLQHNFKLTGLNEIQIGSLIKKPKTITLSTDISVPPTIDEVFNSPKKYESLQDKKARMKKAAQYLIFQGNTLKDLIRGYQAISPTLKCIIKPTSPILNLTFGSLDTDPDEPKSVTCKKSSSSPSNFNCKEIKSHSNCSTDCLLTLINANKNEPKTSEIEEEKKIAACLKPRTSSYSEQSNNEKISEYSKSPIKEHVRPKFRRMTDTSVFRG